MGRRKKGNRIPQLKANCVFCQRQSVTKQHLWPDWIKKVIPRGDKDHHHHIMRFNMLNPEAALIQPEIQFKRGPIGARKIRKVCGKCNGGWMSELESAAKPALTKLMLNENRTLTSDDLLSISLWAVMTSIIAEYTDPPTLAIPEQDRKHIMNHRNPPDNWHIWVGLYNGEQWKQRYRHTGMACVPNSVYRPRDVVCNTQVSTFVVGSLLIHASSSTVPNIFPKFEDEIKNKLIQIWPSSLKAVKWPLSEEINDEQALHISDCLFKQLQFWGSK